VTSPTTPLISTQPPTRIPLRPMRANQPKKATMKSEVFPGIYRINAARVRDMRAYYEQPSCIKIMVRSWYGG